MRLSERLQKVAAYVPIGSRLADIGSDHAYLPTALVQSGQVRWAIAGEVVAGPFASAKGQVEKEGLIDRIDVRLGDGLDVIEPEDGIDCIAIAGMGGPLIASILERGRSALGGVSCIVAQPNVQSAAVRRWALGAGWRIAAESIIEEDGKLYEILALERGEQVLNEAELLMGPFLREERSPAFRKKWERELAQWERVMQSLERAEESAGIRLRRAQLAHNMHLVKEALL